MRNWAQAVLLCLIAVGVTGCQTPTPAHGDRGDFVWGTNLPDKGSDHAAIWLNGATCQGPASDVVEHLQEECVVILTIDGTPAPPGIAFRAAVVPPGPHRILLAVSNDESIEYETNIAARHTYRPHAEEMDGKLYIWLTEHPLPMPVFDDGVVFAGVAPPE